MARKLLLPGCAVLALLLVVAIYRPAQAGPMHGVVGHQGLADARGDSQIVQMARNRGRGRSFGRRSFSGRSFGRRSFGRRSFSRRSHGRRAHRRHHGRRTILLGTPFLFGGYYYDYFGYPDHCERLRRRALRTGSRYWWNRYYDCRYDY